MNGLKIEIINNRYVVDSYDITINTFTLYECLIKLHNCNVGTMNWIVPISSIHGTERKLALEFLNDEDYNIMWEES